MSPPRSRTLLAFTAFVLAGVPSCIDVIDPQGDGPHVAGFVGGLTGTGLTLRSDGETLPITKNGSFSFPEPRVDGDVYEVSIARQPAGQTCRVVLERGTITALGTPGLMVACSLVVGSFNLEWFNATSLPSKKLGIATIIQAAGFGLIAVEEVSSLQALQDFAAEYLGPDWDARLGNSGDKQRVGFLYRTKLLSVVDAGELAGARSGGIIDDTSWPWAYYRLPYHATIQPVSGEPFQFVAVHLKAMGDEQSCETRAAQVQNLEQWLQQHENEAIVVTGDFNDQLAGYGNCTYVDTLAPFQADPQLTFLTSAPAYMASNYYSAVNYRGETIDHIMVTEPMLGMVETLDPYGHKAEVYMHHNDGVSDHQPPYMYVRW